ncbi:hypothetical protein ACS0TY_004456 [Phlomoides rotata]
MLEKRWGFMGALSWVKNLGFQNVIVEGDSKIVVDVILSSSACDSSFGDFIARSKVLLVSCCNVSVAFVKRSVNSMAHAIVRISRNFESPHSWVDPLMCVARLPRGTCSV